MSNDNYSTLFYQALRIRMVEEKIIEIYPSDRIKSPVHLSIGQEAVAVGVCSALHPDDLVFINYRGHAFFLAKGGSLPKMMAELYGKSNGLSKGKAGSMHLSSPDVGVIGASAVVASGIPLAVGASLSMKLKKQDSIAVANFGDGATEEGSYHEALNFASLKELPILFLCENNGLAIHATLVERQSYKIHEHARTYGIASEKVDEGWNFVKIYNVASAVINNIRRHRRPFLLEVRTFRTYEHVGIGLDYTAGSQRKSELDEWQKKDPLSYDKESINRFQAMIATEIEDALSFAESGAVPEKNEIFTDVL